MKQQIVNAKKAYTKNSNREGVELPNIIDMDTLACMSDDELIRLHSHIQNEKDRSTRREEVAIAWEIEACYVQRELKIRSDRRHTHEAYLRSNPDSAFDYYDAQDSEDLDTVLN